MLKSISLLHRLLVSTITVLLLISCARSNDKMPPPLEFEEGYLNNQVSLFVTSQGNTFRTEDPIAIGMTFKTDNEIVFPNNYNLRFFIRDKKSWREIAEKTVERYPSGEFVFSPRTSPQIHFFFVEPDIENTTQKCLLRIYVAGNTMDAGVSKTVASYLDVELRP